MLSQRRSIGACASSLVVSLVWVPRARPQTYHFFGDSRRGNILVLVLVLVLLLPLNITSTKVLSRFLQFQFQIRFSYYLLVSSIRFPLLFYICSFLVLSFLLSLREFVYPRLKVPVDSVKIIRRRVVWFVFVANFPIFFEDELIFDFVTI